jgi:hypothetical protein
LQVLQESRLQVEQGFVPAMGLVSPLELFDRAAKRESALRATAPHWGQVTSLLSPIGRRSSNLCLHSGQVYS